MQRKRSVKNLDLFTIRLPINAVVSIMHRAAGIILFLLLPMMLIAFQQSLVSEASYLTLQQLFNHWLIKLFFIACSWAFFHHFYAGIRHFLQDIHWMSSLQKARLTGRVVLVLVGLSVLLFAWSIF